jgi:hypothetical protein
MADPSYKSNLGDVASVSSQLQRLSCAQLNVSKDHRQNSKINKTSACCVAESKSAGLMSPISMFPGISQERSEATDDSKRYKLNEGGTTKENNNHYDVQESFRRGPGS